MKDSPCHALLLHLKLSSPHYTFVLIKQLLCTEAPSFTSYTSSLLFFVLDKFFLVLVSSLLLHIVAFKVVLPLLCTFCHKRFFAQKLFKLFVRLCAIDTCNSMGRFMLWTFFGHAFSKTCQYVCNDLMVCVGFREVNLKNTHATL